MNYVNITPDIGLKIKEIRIRNNVKAIDLANFLDKSPAYISKLEKGEIKQLTLTTFKKVINFVSQDEKGCEKFLESYLPNIPSDRINENAWLMNLDTIERVIPVPDNLIKIIKNLMHEINISSKELINYINKNTDLDKTFLKENKIDLDTVKKNVWLPYYIDDAESRFRLYIVLNYPTNILDPILSRNQDTCNYTLMYAVVYHLLKLKNKVADSPKEQIKIQEDVDEILNSHKFYSILERSRITRNAKSEEELNSLLNDFDKNNIDLVNKLIHKLLSSIQHLSLYNIIYTNQKLEKIIDNLELDPSFALSYMAISLDALNNTSVNIKHSFLNEVQEIAKEFSEKPESETKFELY